MSISTKMILVLTVITVISGGVLSGWDTFTHPKIEYHRIQELKASIAEVLPAYDYYDELTKDGVTFYIGRKNNESEPIGVAFRVNGSGFQGNIAIMVGIAPNFTTLMGIKVLEQIETPGLGTKITKDPSNKSNPLWFPDQFRGIDVTRNIEVIKNRKPATKYEVEAISGATISSKAVVRILNTNIQIAKLIYLTEL